MPNVHRRKTRVCNFCMEEFQARADALGKYCSSRCRAKGAMLDYQLGETDEPVSQAEARYEKAPGDLGGGV